MKKEIEIARLKKGYIVKGVGVEKEFVTTFDKNIKQLMNLNISIQLNYCVIICLLVDQVIINGSLEKKIPV